MCSPQRRMSGLLRCRQGDAAHQAKPMGRCVIAEYTLTFLSSTSSDAWVVQFQVRYDGYQRVLCPMCVGCTPVYGSHVLPVSRTFKQMFMET